MFDEMVDAWTWCSLTHTASRILWYRQQRCMFIFNGEEWESKSMRLLYLIHVSVETGPRASHRPREGAKII